MHDIDLNYTNLNKAFGDYSADFMNHGYFPSLDIVDDIDSLFKNQISLYLQMFNNIDVSDKKILEIGCGRGGGASAVLKYLKPLSIDACDMNTANIQYCLRNQPFEINFKQSYAQGLRYQDSSFDIVLSIESSHSYDNYHLFFEEVDRVLKQGGIFLYADCGDVIHNFDHFSNYFKKIIREDITENVRKACEEDYIRFNNLIDNENVKNMLVDIAKRKAKLYAEGDSQYIKYIAYK